MAQEATNTFTDGLNCDLHPIATKKTLLTDSKNGTFITFNSNEMSLLNDMGNTKLVYKKTNSEGLTYSEEIPVTLSEGFMPVGMQEHGGVVYIASVNPTTRESEIGSFPSPEYDVNVDPESVSSNELIIMDKPLRGAITNNLDKRLDIITSDDIILDAGDKLEDYQFTNLNFYAITLDESDRRLYKYKIINALNGRDITESCLNLHLDNGVNYSLTSVSNPLWTNSILTPAEKPQMIYYYSDPTKSDIFYYPNIYKSNLLIVFSYEDIDEFQLRTYLPGTTDFTDVNNIDVYGPTVDYDSNDYIKLIFDKLYIKEPSWIKVKSLIFRYKILDKETNKILTNNGVSDYVTKTFAIKLNLSNPDYFYTLRNGTPANWFSSNNDYKIVDINNFTINLIDYKSAGAIANSNKYSITIELTPDDDTYSGVNLSSHTISRTYDLSKSKQSFNGTLVQVSQDIDISLFNIAYRDASENDGTPVTFKSIYQNAVNGTDPKLLQDWTLMFQTELIKTKINISKNDSITGERLLYFSVAMNVDASTKNTNSMTNILCCTDDLENEDNNKYIYYNSSSLKDIGTKSYYKNADTFYGKLTRYAKLTNSDIYNYFWIKEFLNDEFIPCLYGNSSFKKKFNYKLSASAYNNQSIDDGYNSYQHNIGTKSLYFNKLRLGLNDRLSDNGCPTTFDMRDIIYQTDNGYDLYTGQSNYVYNSDEGKRQRNVDVVFPVCKDVLTLNSIFTGSIDAGIIKRELGIFSTEEDYLDGDVGLIGLFTLLDSSGNQVDANGKNAHRLLHLYSACSPRIKYPGLGLKLNISSIQTSLDDFIETLSDVIKLDYSQLDNNNQLIKIDSNGDSLLTNKNYSTSLFYKPSYVNYVDIPDVCNRYTDLLTTIYTSDDFDWFPDIKLYQNKGYVIDYSNAKLFNTQTGKFSRYTILLKHDSTITDYIFKFSSDDFSGYNYGIILMYMNGISSNNVTLLNAFSNYKISITEDCSNFDYSKQFDNTIINDLSNKRIAIVVDLNSSSGDLLLSFTSSSSTGEYYVNVYNPGMYLFDELLETTDGLKCQYFRGLHCTIDWSIDISSDSLYKYLYLPTNGCEVYLGSAISYNGYEGSLVEDYVSATYSSSTGKWTPVKNSTPKLINIADYPMYGYYPLPFYELNIIYPD